MRSRSALIKIFRGEQLAMLEVFISVFVFLRHHSFDASPAVLLMSIFWVIAGTTLLLSPQLGSPYLLSHYIYNVIMSMLLIKDVYFFPSKASVLLLLIPLLNLLPLFMIILIRFFTPRPPNTFIYILCYLTQIFMFLWLEGCGPYAFYKLSGSLALLLKRIAEGIATRGFFPAIFSTDSLVLIYYSVLTVFHYQINLSFMHAQNTAAIRETKLFFAPSFIPLQRFRLLYLISLIVQQFFENIVFSIYFVYCALVFVNAYLIASRGSLSHVHNGPWITLSLSTFILFYSCYNTLITIFPLIVGKVSRYSTLLMICLPISLAVSVGVTVTLLVLRKRIRINVINDHKRIKVRHSSSFRGRHRCLTIRLLSTIPAKNVSVKVLTSDGHHPAMQKDTAVLLDPTAIQNYTLHTPLSKSMVMILAFYFDIHTVASFVLPNDYTFTTDDINSLVYLIKDSRSTRRLPEERVKERPGAHPNSIVSLPQLHSDANNLIGSPPFTSSIVDSSNIERPRSASATHRHTTFLHHAFSIPDTSLTMNREALAVEHLVSCSTDVPAPCYKSSNDALTYPSNSSSEDSPNLYGISATQDINCPLPTGHTSKASTTPKTGCETPKELPLTPNQKIFRDFLGTLDPQKIFTYVVQAENLLEDFRLFYENIYASLFLSYCAASQTLESMTLLDIEECLPIPLLLRYLRAWKTPSDAYNSIIYYIDQLKSVDDLKREYQAARATRRELEHASTAPNATRSLTLKPIFVEARKIPSFTCSNSCTNCPRCRVHAVCNHCHAKIAILLKSTFNFVMGRMKTDKPPSRGFNCPDCNRPCSLKIVESLSKKQNRKIPGITLHTTSVKPRILQNYTTFLNKLTPLGRRIQTPTAYSRKKLPAVDFLSFETVSEQTDTNLPHSRQHSKRLSRDVVQLLLKAFINDMENSINEETPMICEWATQKYASTNATDQASLDAKQRPNSNTDSKMFSRDQNIGLLHKSYSVISPQNFNGSIYFLSPEIFADVTISEESKSFLYNCRKQNYLFTIFLPTITSTSSTTGNIHRLSFAYDRAASLTSPLRILRMKVLIHLARMLFPVHLYVNSIYPIQLVPCYKFYTLGRSYIENATNRVSMIYSPEFLLKRQKDSEVRVISKNTSLKRSIQAMYHQEPLYLYCLAQNALTIKTQDKMDSSILQFVNVEYLFMQAAFTGISSSYLSFFYRLYYTNNVSFFTHLLSLSKHSSDADFPVDLTTKLDKHGSSLSTIPGSIVINGLSIALNCHTLSDQTADAYAVIDRLLGGMYSVQIPIYTWLEMAKIRLSTCTVYLELLRGLNSDIFSRYESVPAITSSHSVPMEMSSIPSIPSGLELDADEKRPPLVFEHGITNAERQDKTRLRHGHSFNVSTLEDYHRLHDAIAELLSVCQALLDKQVSELGFPNESHEVQMTRILDGCKSFFRHYYVFSTQHLLHVVFDLPGIVKYAPRNTRSKPIYRYRNGIPELITHSRKYSNHPTDTLDATSADTEELESESSSDYLESPPLRLEPDIEDSGSDVQDNSTAFVAHSLALALDGFNKLFIPQLPHMATSSHPKALVISKKQIAANLFAIYEHVILENDMLETILLNNITINGLPSIDINGMPFSLLSLLGKTPSRCVDGSPTKDSSDTPHGCTPTTSIDVAKLQDLLSSHAQALAKEKCIDKLMQHFSSRSLYDKVGSDHYSQISAPRLRQIILSLITDNASDYQSSASGYGNVSLDNAPPSSSVLDSEPCAGAAPALPNVSATFSATFSTSASTTYSHITEAQNTFTEPLVSAKDFAFLGPTMASNVDRFGIKRKAGYKSSKLSSWKFSLSSLNSSKLLRRFISKGSKSSSLSLLEPEKIKLFLRAGSTYIPFDFPLSDGSVSSSLASDPVSTQQLLLAMIVMLNLLHLYSSSNVLTTYEYRGRQLLTLQQNRFIVDSTGGYYPAAYRQELEQSYTLNFNTQNPDDAVKKFIYCFDESFTGLFPIKNLILCKRYLNTDFDLTIPIDGMKYIHVSDSPSNLLAPTSRSKWLENLKQPDFNTPINVYECIEAQVSMNMGFSLIRYRLRFRNLLLYNSIVFDTLIQLRNIIRVDSTLRAKIHAYKMLPRLGMFSNHSDALLKSFFEKVINIQDSILTSDPSALHIPHGGATMKASIADTRNSAPTPMLIHHCKRLHECLDVLCRYEHILQSLWTMRLTLLRHSYAEEDFLLLLQNECLRALSTSYGIPSEYFFALFSNIMNLDPETKQCYMSSSIEHAFPKHYALLYQLRSSNQDDREVTLSYPLLDESTYARQQNVIRYFSAMEYDAKRIETANRKFFITIAELFALGKDPLGQIEHILAASPRAAGAYILGPTFDTLQLFKGTTGVDAASPHSNISIATKDPLDKAEEPKDFDDLAYSSSTLADEPTNSLCPSSETTLSMTQNSHPPLAKTTAKDVQHSDSQSIFRKDNSTISNVKDDSFNRNKRSCGKPDLNSGACARIHTQHWRIVACLYTNSSLILITLFYIFLVCYLLFIYSYSLTNHVIAKSLLQQGGHISGMMAALSDLQTEINMNVALQQTKNNPFEILSSYAERFNEIANNAYSAHVITAAMYNGLSINDVVQRELELSAFWPPPMLYYSGEQIMNVEDLNVNSGHQNITCTVTMGTLSDQSIATLTNSRDKWPANLSYLKSKLLPLKNLKYLLNFKVWTQARDFLQLQQSDIKEYLDTYNEFSIGLYDGSFRNFITNYPVTIPITSSYSIEQPDGTLKDQLNSHSTNYFETTDILVNRVVCIAASMIYISQQASSFNPQYISSKASSMLTLYRPMASLMLETDFLQTTYQSMYVNLQEIMINTWAMYSRYTLNRLVLLAFTFLAVGLFIPLYYLSFQRVQRRLLKAKLDRACTLANILSLPKAILESLMDNYAQASMIPFKQFLWGNKGYSATDIDLPREYYSDIYSYTQSKSVYNQTHFNLAELTIHSSKVIENNVKIKQHNDPDCSLKFYSHTDEISLILRLVAIYDNLSNSKMHILLYTFACMVFFFFFIVNMTFPLHFRSPFVSSGLDINSYYGHWGNVSHLAFQLPVNGWDSATIDTEQLAQQQLYNISQITKYWAAVQSTPSSFIVDGSDLVAYMTGIRATEFASDKLYSPFYINKYMDELVQTPFLYAFDYIKDHTKLVVSLLQWLDDVSFISSASYGASRCLECTTIYYLLQYVLKVSPVSLIYQIELLSHLSSVSTEDLIKADYYLDFFTVHKRFLDVFSNIHDNLWQGLASSADVSTISAFMQRYKYFANYNTTGAANYDESAAIALVDSVPPNTALPSMVNKHENLVRKLLERLYGGSIIFDAIIFLLFLISLTAYLIVGCVFVYKSVLLTVRMYTKISAVTRCACSIKYLVSCFLPLDLMFLVPALLVVALIMSLPIIYDASTTMVAIFGNYINYPLSAEAILRENAAFSHQLTPLSYTKFSTMQTITNYLALLIFLLSSLSHHVILRSRTVIDTVGYIRYTKGQEQELFNAEKNPFVLSIKEKVTICRPANNSAMDHDKNDDSNDSNAYFNLYDDYIPTADSLACDDAESIGKAGAHKPNKDPFLREECETTATYDLPVFLPPLFIPKQKLEYVEVFLRYALICLLICSIHLLLSASRLADYNPRNIPIAFLDQLIHNYNVLRGQLSQMYAYPPTKYRESHLIVTTFRCFRQLITFLLANKYTQRTLSIPIQSMRVFKNTGIDNAFYQYGQHIKDFLQSNIYGYTNRVMDFSGSSVEYDPVMPTTWMSGSKYYNMWSNLPPNNRSRLFVSTKIPNYHKDGFADNSVLFPLYQKLLLFEYAYYQPNFANIQKDLDNLLTRSATGTYGYNFPNFLPEHKKIIFFDILRNQMWTESLYCNHYLRMAGILLHSISILRALTELSVLLIIILVVAIIHITAYKLLLLFYNKKLTLYEVFTVLLLKRIRGLVN